MLDRTAGRPQEWAPETIERLKRYWNDEGLTAGQISIKFDGEFSRNAVLGKAYRLGLEKRRDAMYKLTPAQKIERAKAHTRRKIERQAERRTETRARLPDKSLPPLIIEETPKPAEFLGLTFDAMNRAQCWYPRGEGPAMRFCGQPATHRSYCDQCFALAYQVGPPHSLRHSNREMHSAKPGTGEGL